MFRSEIDNVTDISICYDSSSAISLFEYNKKDMYKLTKSINCRLFDCDHQIWCDILSFDIDAYYYYENVYLPLA